MDKQLPEVELVACEICCKEVPITAAQTPESVDYVAYFCGLECYAEWKKQSGQLQDEAIRK
ncbi:MAG: DUF3330 domain-containing protein [Gallionella sp.]|nr:DUF3330 domain-containing protein [Gallionella sp.]